MYDKLKRMDWSIVAIMAIFGVISTLTVHSATIDDPLFKNANMHVKNMINFGLGFIVLFVVSLLDYRWIQRITWYIYAVGIVLLVAVYFLGVETNGARSWFSLPLGFNLQPAELMKLLIIVAVAYMMSRREGDTLTIAEDVVPIGVIVFVPFALVLIQPDLGNAIIYLVILLGMLWIGNIKYMYVLIGTAAIALFLFSFVYLYNTYHDSIEKYLTEQDKEHWVSRIDTFLSPENVSRDEKYQVTKAKIAIGSGSLTGDGYMQGNSVRNNFIPYAYSDSIFVVIAEEFGFVGSSLLLLLYFLLIYRMILISIQSSTLSGSYIIIGIVSMFVFQIFENIGMLIGIMPLTGITLPFISYGGSSLLINMLCIGLVLSVKVHQDKEALY